MEFAEKELASNTTPVSEITRIFRGVAISYLQWTFKPFRKARIFDGEALLQRSQRSDEARKTQVQWLARPGARLSVERECKAALKHRAKLG